ncbi:MAG: peptidase E [Algicola sp.]|nr:peptidase E [Algicola sp.]
MKTYIKYISLPFLLVFLAFGVHKYYVSITQIEYVEDQASVQIISRVFIDDLENALKKRYDKTLVLKYSNESEQVDYYLERYLKSKISIKINGKEQLLTFIGKEYDADIAVCYLEIKGVKEIAQLEISNQVLFDMFDDQQNVIRAKIYNKNKSFLLIKENDKALLNFKEKQ